MVFVEIKTLEAWSSMYSLFDAEVRATFEQLHVRPRRVLLRNQLTSVRVISLAHIITL
jgi:hypothetical protein